MNKMGSALSVSSAYLFIHYFPEMHKNNWEKYNP